MNEERLLALAPILGIWIVLIVVTGLGRLLGYDADVAMLSGLIAGVGSAATLERADG